MPISPITIRFTPGNPDRASAVVAGRTFTAASQAGAVLALCRELVAAGVHDAPWVAIPAGRDAVAFSGRSIRHSAGFTCSGTKIIRLPRLETGPSESPVRPEGRPFPDMAPTQDSPAGL